LDDKISRNESLYIILNGQGVSPEKIHEIQQEAKGKVRLNRMMVGQKYRLYRDEEGVFAFVWHRSATEFTTINWKDDITIENGSIPVDTVVRTVSGTIHSSLASALMEQEVSQRLVVELANIYAWTVDFYALQMGDKFKAVYEDRYVNGEYIGIGKVRAAEFVHRGKELRAYFYDFGEDSGYYDAEGNSMRRAMMRVPFEYNPRISSSFSRNRYHPILKRNRPHYGTDYAAPTGTPILAAGDGVVTEAQRRGGNGNIVQIKHNSVYKTAYLHMSRFARGIHAGATVQQGQVIGYVGQTGLATGPHLCYRLYKNNSPVNSVTYDFPPSEGLKDIYMEEFKMKVDRFDDMFDSASEPDELAMK
jgi:murein DD-endopeptidase MepM/ murein hydrolase activator NlpD